MPAGKLAFKFSADVDPPNGLPGEESKSIPAIQDDFDARRKDEALLRTVASPDGQRASGSLGAADDSNTTTFRIDLYSSEETSFATSRRRTWQLSFRIPWFGPVTAIT